MFGLLVAAALPLPLPVMIALGAAFGISHGHTNGRRHGATHRRAPVGPWLAAVGGLVTALMSAAIIDLAETEWLRIGVRVAGSWIAAIGLMMLRLA